MVEMENKKSKGSARVLGSGIAGITELAIFHPVDTISKRLMNSPVPLSSKNYAQILFQERPHVPQDISRQAPISTTSQTTCQANAPKSQRMMRGFSSVAAGSFESTQSVFLRRAKSLYPGIGYGAIYKVSQRIYKFGGQPFVQEILAKNTDSKFLSNALAGAIVGIGEVALLPFDVLKIKSQTNPEYRKMAFSHICKIEGIQGLYAGAGWTAMRNVMGSFMLFGMNSLVKESLKDRDSNSFVKLALSSTAGSVSSILIACPLDVVKTRMQSGNFKSMSGISIIKDIAKNEGIGGFFKGAIPKVFTVGPKLIFSFTLAQYLINALG